MLGETLTHLISALLSIINEFGYLGIFIGMTIESSFFPFPSEIILIPAGALVAQGKMSFWFVLMAGLLGSLVGAILNYFLAFFLGRKAVNALLKKYGKFLFLSQESLNKSDRYFSKHGEITTFIGRLIIVVRQLISLPAGFSRMNFFKFCLYTSLGAAVWTAVLIAIGYFFGSNIDSTQKLTVSIILFLFAAIVGITYFIFKRKRNH